MRSSGARAVFVLSAPLDGEAAPGVASPPMSDAPSFTPPAPGPEHRVFEKDVGTWDADVEVRMPGAPLQTSRGVAVNRLVCGGLWLVGDFRNETSGFEGHGVYGYDPQTKKYVGTW